MFIQRAYEPLDQYLRPNRVLVIYGARRVGKTTLLQNYLAQTRYKYKLASGDDLRVRDVLSSQDFSRMLAFVEGYELLALDEAQMIPAIGQGLKILVDQVKNLRVIATGSSSFELAGQVGEPLTGRKHILSLYPFSVKELAQMYNSYELRQNLAAFLTYGTYPEVIQAPTLKEKISVLTEIANSYLLKDILAFERVKHSRTLLHLLQLLAFQIGSEVSHNELATKLGVDTKTLQRYLDLLEKAFVIFRLNGFSRNKREEITSKPKYYFWDTGIRNAIIAQFNSLEQRNDVGVLWENYALVERLKQCAYQGIYANFYFWRTYQQQEVDLIEERDGMLYAYEFKWSVRKAREAPAAFRRAYPEAVFSVVTPEEMSRYL